MVILSELSSRLLDCRGAGWDSSEVCIQTAIKLQKRSGLEARSVFRLLDFTKEINQSDLHQATYLFVYLPLLGLEKIRGLLEKILKENEKLKMISNEYHFLDHENWIIFEEKDTIRISRPKT